MAHDKERALIPNGDEIDVDTYLGMAHITGREYGGNFRLALPNPVFNIVATLRAVDTETHPDVTMGTEIRAAILYYADIRRQQPGFDEQIERVRAELASVALNPDPWPDAYTQTF